MRGHPCRECHLQNRSCDSTAARRGHIARYRSGVGAPEPIDHSPGNHDGIVCDLALLLREHAVDRQEPVGVDAHPVR